MTRCCIVSCGARKNNNRPELTLHRYPLLGPHVKLVSMHTLHVKTYSTQHKTFNLCNNELGMAVRDLGIKAKLNSFEFRFPRNETMRKKWLEAIREENINPRQKNWFICSLHFEDSCFNRTLDVARLHDDSLPTIFPHMASENTPVLCEKRNSNRNVDSSSPSFASIFLPSPKPPDEVQKASKCDADSLMKISVAASKLIESAKYKNFKEKLMKQRRVIKRLSEKLRRRNKTIANLKDIIQELQQKSQFNEKNAIIIITDSEGSQDLLKRLVNNSK